MKWVLPGAYCARAKPGHAAVVAIAARTSRRLMCSPKAEDPSLLPSARGDEAGSILAGYANFGVIRAGASRAQVRTAIERMSGPLKGLRRIATCHDQLATNFLATACLAAIFSDWL
jgi:hypothetical protein